MTKPSIEELAEDAAAASTANDDETPAEPMKLVVKPDFTAPTVMLMVTGLDVGVEGEEAISKESKPAEDGDDGRKVCAVTAPIVAVTLTVVVEVVTSSLAK